MADVAEMVKLSDFIKGAGVTMTCERAEDNPNMDSDSRDTMDHWRCVLRAGRARMTVIFSMGAGLQGRRPELSDVLDCLASDASGFENARGFDDWCGEYGYDTDSRKAERIYRTVEREAGKLKRFLGESAYQTLLWNTERQ